MARVQLRRIYQQGGNGPRFVDHSPVFETPSQAPTWHSRTPVDEFGWGNEYLGNLGQFTSNNHLVAHDPAGENRGVRMDLLANPDAVRLMTYRGGSRSVGWVGADKVTTTVRLHGSVLNRQGVYFVLESARTAGGTVESHQSARLIVIDATGDSTETVLLDSAVTASSPNTNLQFLTAGLAYTAGGQLVVTWNDGVRDRSHSVTPPNGVLFEGFSETGPFSPREASPPPQPPTNAQPKSQWSLLEPLGAPPFIGSPDVVKRRMMQRGDSRFGPGGKTHYNSMRRGPGVVF